MRCTRKDVAAVFGRLVTALGPETTLGWELDHNGAYGGWVVTSDNGHGRPLGDRRRTATEFCEAVWFALRVLEHSAPVRLS